jgi:hypothetical protein
VVIVNNYKILCFSEFATSGKIEIKYSHKNKHIISFKDELVSISIPWNLNHALTVEENRKINLYLYNHYIKAVAWER